MASTTGGMVMEKPTQEQLQQALLKCPRCDSSNTKFCYYNNYSLSQPRHFCKACKRYWTKGGTLRNVPVGGGCRKNKRVKRPAATDSPSSIASAPMSTTTNPNYSQPQIDPLFYGLHTNNPHSHELNLSFPRFNPRVDSVPGGYNLQSQMNALGLGFSSGLMASDVNNNDYQNGFISHASKSLLSSYPPIFGSSSTSTSAASPTMASLTASNLQQQKYISASGWKDIRAANSFLGFVPAYDDMQMQGSNNGGGISTKDEKLEECQNSLDWNGNVPCQNQMEQIGSSDPSSLLWNATGVCAWLDPANIGSSVPSLI